MAIKSKTVLQTTYGPFEVQFHEVAGKGYVSFSRGDLSRGTPIMRLQSGCLFGEAFSSLECDCDQQLQAALEAINSHGIGTIIYSYSEGRGIGLENKIAVMEIQRSFRCDSREAFARLGFDKGDYRDYQAELQILGELGIAKNIQLFSRNEKRLEALRMAGFTVNFYE